LYLIRFHVTPSGASGAGKTTFMDVIAGRKNQGRITGDIRVNGHPQACTQGCSRPQQHEALCAA